MKRLFCVSVLLVAATAATAHADPNRDAIVAALAAAAKQSNSGFTAFSAEAGKAFWMATQTGGKPDTPSCTTCHGNDPKGGGQTRAGKPIEPMAVSVNPQRFTDPEKVAKWFGRNCNSVLGRECSAEEKVNVLAYLTGQ